MQEYVSVLKKYTVFSGRASRREYWMFALFSFIISIVLSILDSILGLKTSTGGVLSGLYSLAVLLPSIAVGIRRLHDVHRSGWFLLIGIIPLIGTIYLIVLLATQGDQGDNQYGPPPSSIAAA